MILKLILLGLIVALWVIGGQTRGRIRDVPVPLIIALYCAIVLKTWWLFLVLGVMFQVIRIGYGNYDPENDPEPSFLASITHDRNGWYIRAIWGFIVGSIGILSLLLGHFLGVLIYLGYVVLNTGVNFSVSRFGLPVIITDILVSLCIGSVLFLV